MKNDPSPAEKNQMSFWDHLDELRSRALLCLYVFFGGFVGCYLISDQILAFLRKPLFAHLPPDKQHLYYTGLFENFFVHLRVAGFASLALLSPVYFLILWRFVAPGLYENERRTVIPFAAAASLFFLGGVAFAYFVLFPAGVKYFLSYGTPAEVAWLTLDHYVSLVTKILFGFGLAFQLPVVTVLLVRIGVISAETLASQRRIAIIVITIVSGVVAPPDAVSMLILMAPLYLLFEGSLLVARFLERKRDQKRALESNADKA